MTKHTLAARLPFDVAPVMPEDRARWRRGEWDSEPDIAMWTTSVAGHVMYCAIVRHSHLGHLCGYVGVLADHPNFATPCDYSGEDTDCFWPTVHGGVTWDDTKDGVRWFGFDCAHSQDVTPYSRAHYDGLYKDFEYVTHEVRSLAVQIAQFVPTKEIV